MMGKQHRHTPAGRWISMLYRCTQSHLARRLEPYGIGKGQVGFLMRLYHAEGVSQDELASSLFMDKGTTARALDHLERKGFVERVRDREDGRVNRVYLTEKAQDLRPVLRRILKEWNRTLFSGFNPGEREEMMEALHRMADTAAGALEREKRNEVD